ncbi:MAG: glycosyltransferase [Aliishimia sp.]
MHIVFAHQAFPAQFGAFGHWLSKQGWSVTFLTADTNATPPKGCQMVHTSEPGQQAQDLQPHARVFEIATLNTLSFGAAATSLRHDHGLVPDVVMAHSGLGVGSFAKSVWPEAHFVPYVEWFYRYPHVDLTEDERPSLPEDARALALARNAPTLVDLAVGDAAICPTQFQADQFPPHLRARMTVLHDGVDCSALTPNTDARMDIAGLSLPDNAEIVTYATRGMELHRGFPQFMRVLSELQKTRPNLHAVIGGEDRVAYGAQLPEGQTWKSRMLEELDLDLSRVHFVGPLPRPDYLRLMQASHAHIYFTVPFVLSWSLIEAMSVGCTLVASDVVPVREALTHRKNAELVDHDNIAATSTSIARVLDDRVYAKKLAQQARKDAIRRYDAAWVWPARAALLETLVKTQQPI